MSRDVITNAPPTLKDPNFWTTEEKKTRKIDRLARSLLIQGILNDIYSLIDSNETTKDLWDALERQMRGSEYGEQDRKAQNQGDVNDALGYKKKVVVVTSDPLALVAVKTKITTLLAKAFNRKKYYAKPKNNNLRTSSASSSANKKPEYVKSVEMKEDKRADEKKRDMSKVKYYNCKKEGHFAKDCKKSKVKDYNNYKTKMLLAKKDTQIKKVLSDSDESSSSAEETIAEKRIEKANQQTKDLENQNTDLQDKYDVLINQVNTFEEKNNKFNEQMKVLNEKNADLFAQMKVLQDQLKVKHVVIDTHTECQAQYEKLEEERYEYMIRYSALCDNDKQHRKKIDEQEILFDKMSRQLVEMNNNVLKLQDKILEKETKISELEGCVSNKDVEIEKCLKRLNECFENPSYYEKAKDLRPSIYDEKIIGLGYTPMFLIHLDEALEIKKFKRARENKIEFAYDYGNLNTNTDTFSSVRRPRQSSVIWKKKGSSNTSNVDLSSVSHSKLNKDVKQYSRKDLLSCNNSHLGETSAYVCNDAMNVSCNSRLCDSFDENNLFIFNDESIVQIYLWIIDSGRSKHMMGNRALLTNFVKKFLGTVRFGNNDFTVIAGYGDVVIGSMTINKVYYVEG
nr:integrase, catalytic region, zinc finger, CCHC-type, peptidase aspartic, catalytic [Tanacetum cinerariifolium]